MAEVRAALDREHAALDQQFGIGFTQNVHLLGGIQKRDEFCVDPVTGARGFYIDLTEHERLHQGRKLVPVPLALAALPALFHHLAELVHGGVELLHDLVDVQGVDQKCHAARIFESGIVGRLGHGPGVILDLFGLPGGFAVYDKLGEQVRIALGHHFAGQVQGVNHAVEFLFRNIQGRLDADYIVGSVGHERVERRRGADSVLVKQVAREQGAENALGAAAVEEQRRVIPEQSEFHTQHQALAAHVLDDFRILFLERGEFFEQVSALFRGALDEP